MESSGWYDSPRRYDASQIEPAQNTKSLVVTVSVYILKPNGKLRCLFEEKGSQHVHNIITY